MKFYQFAFLLLCISGVASAQQPYTQGKLLFEEDFSSEESFTNNWQVQLFKKGSEKAGYYHVKNGKLEVLSESGCTVWLTKKLKGNVKIEYDVKVDTSGVSQLGKIMISDVNCFWMASAPKGKSLFDSSYNGMFLNYHNMQAYYASLGGRFNTTTRSRRYPRDIDSKHVKHISLGYQDGKEKIKDAQEMHITLISYNGLVQYFVNNKLVYEFKPDTIVQTEIDKVKGVENVTYSLKKYPAYTKGYFGFRLTTSRHFYDNVKIYRLN
ncbi:DUF6250 domain-containing protein [Flammeovirga kamogawensis]|nr:DUF6250 domain-containing protein [Flammeovirga kamogawensis]